MTLQSPRIALVFAACGLVLGGCGTTEPTPLEPVDPVVPADLCAQLQDSAPAGLDASSTTTESGDPTATCSLRSEPGAKREVRALVTLLVLNEEDTADTTYDSQCRAIDRTEFALRKVSVEGADEVCAGAGKKADSAILALVAGRRVVTVRYGSVPPGKPSALDRAVQLAEAALSPS